MRIGIIGAGSVGSALGTGWARAGHEVVFGVRDEERYRDVAREAGENARLASVATAAADGEVVVLAVPFGAVPDVLETLDVGEKPLVDCTNPIGADLDASGAERVAELAPDARVVKAFNSVGAEHFVDPETAGLAATVPYCGDDDEATSVVAALGEDLGLDVVDAGDLAAAELLESLARLWIHLSRTHGRGVAFRLLRE